MQSGRESWNARRAKTMCPKCGDPVDLSRMRTHLREAHQVGSVELESSFLFARREARRSSRALRR